MSFHQSAAIKALFAIRLMVHLLVAASLIFPTYWLRLCHYK